jgi:hypothetical protein
VTSIAKSRQVGIRPVVIVCITTDTSFSKSAAELVVYIRKALSLAQRSIE